jgi:hypothetical protein
MAERFESVQQVREGLAGVNYEADTDPNVAVPSLQG